tara:strand:+ start:389 stop:1108 length:720 start_codon:yes stop_codon:yes gene_type:complete
MSHSYKSLYNFPTERLRNFYTYCYWSGGFTEDEMKKLHAQMNECKLERGSTIQLNPKSKANTTNTNAKYISDGNTIIQKTPTAGQGPNEAVRKSDVAFVYRDEKTAWIFERLNFIIESLNAQFYNFDVNGYEMMQYTVYHDHEKGKYDFHQDTIMGHALPDDMYETRKLSVTFLLSEPGVDFEGGEFQINSGEEKNSETIVMKKGDVIVFPSFLIHRVKPVTKGTRKSIVIWVVGPKFR